MRSTTVLPEGLVALLLASTTTALELAPELSFGHRTPISSDSLFIPDWQIQSTANHRVQILSDRVVATPPVPGNVKASLWGERAVEGASWRAEVDFRTSGQEGGKGNIQMWYVRDKDEVGMSSAYDVGTFDGLALVLDQYGGRGGRLRGFLNDGSENFAQTGNVERKAFGHCDYTYRNLGRPSKLAVTHDNGLTVELDDRPCFSSANIQLPTGYRLGFTAHSAENPDSVEVLRFVVYQARDPPAYSPPPTRDSIPPPPRRPITERFPGAPEALADAAADTIRSSDAQFADLHNRMQGLSHQFGDSAMAVSRLSQALEQQHAQLMQRLPGSPASPPQLDELLRRLGGMEHELAEVKRAVSHAGMRDDIKQLHDAVEHMNGGVMERLPHTIHGREFPIPSCARPFSPSSLIVRGCLLPH